jgi:hypothetical protein
MVDASSSQALDRLLTRWVSELKRHYGAMLSAVCLYGSVARGTYRPHSDIDFLVVLRSVTHLSTSPSIDAMAVHKAVGDTPEHRAACGARTPTTGNLAIYTVEGLHRHPPLLLDIMVEGNILYDPEGILKGELDSLRQRTAELGSKRIVLPDGRWYWILKPGVKFGETMEL